MNSIRNIAIVAHADAGKTSLTENFLFFSGKNKTLGKVDDGTALSDYLDVEKERGISVRSSLLSFQWKGTLINLIDTPGHVDFTADVERVLRISDGVILVISAVEGVQANTEILWSALQKYNIPTLIFINKIDRLGSDTETLKNELKKLCGNKAIYLFETENEGTPQAAIRSLFEERNCDESIIEAIGFSNETILDQYLETGVANHALLTESLRKAVRKGELVPVFCGAAKNSLGISELLDAVVSYLPAPPVVSSQDLSALVYGTEHDKTMGKVALIKVFAGSIATRQVIHNSRSGKAEKIIQVRKYFGGKYEEIPAVYEGDLAGLCGLNDVAVGDILGISVDVIPKVVCIRNPLLTVQVSPVEEKDYPTLADALTQLCSEDPALEFEWLREDRELHIRVMGWIQIEVLQKILESRFGLKTTFGNPLVIYKETPATSGEGFVQYWMPKPCWAILKFRIEPGERGSGVIYRSEIGVNDVLQKYQNEVERTIPVSLKQGIKGWEVTDLVITLIEGSYHEIHSRPGDFVVATPMGIMNGLEATGTILLEPILEYKIIAPESLLGSIAGDITQMRGTIGVPEIENGKFILSGILPMATSLDYSIKLSSKSGGKARITTNLIGYQPCSDEQGIIRPYKGISPLDTAKYILKARKALM